MNFLYFITDNSNEFQTLVHNIMTYTRYESMHIREEEKWLIKANNVKKRDAKKSYFEYSYTDFDKCPDVKYLLEPEQYSTIKNTLPLPIIHEFNYNMTYTINGS